MNKHSNDNKREYILSTCQTIYTVCHCVLATESHFKYSHAHRYMKFITSNKLLFWNVLEEKQSGLSTLALSGDIHSQQKAEGL